MEKQEKPIMPFHLMPFGPALAGLKMVIGNEVDKGKMGFYNFSYCISRP